MMKVLSIDIETYGLAKQSGRGLPLPEQHHFHPARCLVQDGVALDDLILTVSITLPEGIESWTHSPINSSTSQTISSATPSPTPQALTHGLLLSPFNAGSLRSLLKLRPGKSIVFQMWNPLHRKRLAEWLLWADVLVGFNLGFDLLMLRALPEYKHILDGVRHLLVDASILNTYHNESRCFMTLKEIAVTFGLTPKNWGTPENFRYERANDSQLALYNATDTHVTILVLTELLRRLYAERWDNSDTIPDYVIPFYSGILWTCIFMSEAGIAFDRSKLTSLRNRLLFRRARSGLILKDRFGVVMSGTGRDESRAKFLSSALETCPPDLLDHPLLEYTSGKKAISFSDQNRNLINASLPATSPFQLAFLHIAAWVHADKLLTSYVLPLLGQRLPTSDELKLQSKSGGWDGNPLPDPGNKSACVPYPANPSVVIAYPTWYPIRSLTKEGSSGGGGGTRQSRLAARNPAGQTFPPAVTACQSSRYSGGSVVSVDLSQIELRGEALLSGDPFLCRTFLEDRDQHADLAVFVEGEQIKQNPHFGSGDRRKDPRQWYKQSNFLISYRGGWGKFQATLLKLTGRLFTEPFCKNVVYSTRELQSGLWQWQDQLISEVKRTGRLILPLTGQSRDFEADHGPEICNFTPQSLAANTMLAVATRTRLMLLLASKGILLFQNIHDALKLDCPSHRNAEGRALLKSAIEYVATEGYWGQMERLVSRHIPLSYKVK
jgi:hypothetical protein